MELSILEKVWGSSDKVVFISNVKGWTKDEKTMKYKSSSYLDIPFKSPTVATTYLSTADTSSTDYYFCPMQFDSFRRVKENVEAELDILWADLDEVNPKDIQLRPTIAWHSSENRYQCMWILDKTLPKLQIETLNKRMTYKVGADKSGWDLTQVLRIPGSKNHKYGFPQECKLLWNDSEVTKLQDVYDFLDSTTTPTVTPKKGLSESDLSGWLLSKRAKELLLATEAPQGERSDRLWELEKLLIEAGLPMSTIVDLLEKSVWNKFKDRPNGREQLLKETLKAEEEFKIQKTVEAVKKEAKKLKVDSYNDLIFNDTRDPQYLIKGFIQYASAAIMAAEPKCMKTFTALDMALSVASGKRFLNVYPVEQAPVLYLQEEVNTSEIKKRIMLISEQKGIASLATPDKWMNVPELPFYITNNVGYDLTTEEDRNSIENFIVEKGIKFLVIDPLYMVLGGAQENDATQIRPILKYLTVMREKYQCAVLLVHHFKKDKTAKKGARLRGSSIFEAWLECGLYMDLKDGIDGDVLMYRQFRSFKSSADLHIVFGQEAGKYSVYVDPDTDPSLSFKAPPMVARTSAVEEDDEEPEEEEVETQGDEIPELKVNTRGALKKRLEGRRHTC